MPATEPERDTMGAPGRRFVQYSRGKTNNSIARPLLRLVRLIREETSLHLKTILAPSALSRPLWPVASFMIGSRWR